VRPASQNEPRARRRADFRSVGPRRPVIEPGGVQRIVYEVQQHFRYVYDAPILNLEQRLVVIPRPVHGDQRVLSHHIEVSQPTSRRYTYADRFGNTVSEIDIAAVGDAIDFDVSLTVERSVGNRPHLETASRPTLSAYRMPSALTEPDQALRAVAAALADRERSGVELAVAVGGWVYRHMRYGLDLTGPSTTAGQVLAARHGVCQDYAHLMVALCRLLDIPARYVSGHLLGEGGTHAWVEVLQPEAGGLVEITAWDPTHDRPTDHRYLTVAAGRDYRDVAPVSGVCCGPRPGRLSTSRRVRSVTARDEIAA
jgi:transglutaminase-like putative cysteine protease